MSTGFLSLLTVHLQSQNALEMKVLVTMAQCHSEGYM